MAFQVESCLCIQEQKGDGICTLPEYRGKGTCYSLYVADSESMFVNLLGLGVWSRSGQSNMHRAQLEISESLLWNAEFIFPEKQL